MAWVTGGIVTNFVMIRSDQVPEFESATVRLIDPGNLDVRTGDIWDGEYFYRDGAQLPLEPEEPTEPTDPVDPDADDPAVEEVLQILEGGGDDGNV